MLKKKLTYFTFAALIAYGYFLLTTYIFFNITDRNVLISTVLNVAVIIIFVALDKIELIFRQFESVRLQNISRE